jgi:hypothetical protein
MTERESTNQHVSDATASDDHTIEIISKNDLSAQAVGVIDPVIIDFKIL